MSYPKFYDKIEKIELYDPLSEVLGAFEDGKYSIEYKDVVKSAGHSCPTVAGAYIMTLKALEALYVDETPKRGEIEVFFKEGIEDGVAGVIANVITHITGATKSSGFKGLNGKFARHSLMHFNSNIKSSARFVRKDNKKAVDLFYNPQLIKPDAKMQPLMQKILQDIATIDEKREFASLWQDRVKRIFENIDKVIEVKEV